MNKNILILFTCLLLSSCGFCGSIGQDDTSLNEVSMTFQRVIDKLEEFKIRTGSYPSSNEMSSGVFWSEITRNEDWYVYQGIEFGYHAYEGSVSRSEEERSRWGGYELSIYDIREFVTMLDVFDTAIKYVYRPTQYYPERKYEKPKKRVGNWALVRLYRNSSEDRSNPVVDSN